MNKEDAIAKVIAGGIVLGVIALILAVLTIPLWFNTIPEGHRGVHTEWGAVKTDTEIQPGAKIVTPIQEGVTNINVRYQTIDQNGLSIKTEDGLNIKADASLRYRVQPDKAVELYKENGKNYVQNTALKQKFREALKNTADNYDEDIYKGKRTQYTNDVEANLKDSLNATGLVVDSIQVKNINMPERVESRIEDKISKKHEIEAAKREVEVEKQRAKAKIEEAKGTAESMEILQNRLKGETGERWLRLQFIRDGMQKGDMVYMMGNPSQPFTFNEQLPKTATGGQ